MNYKRPDLIANKELLVLNYIVPKRILLIYDVYDAFIKYVGICGLGISVSIFNC